MVGGLDELFSGQLRSVEDPADHSKVSRDSNLDQKLSESDILNPCLTSVRDKALLDSAGLARKILRGGGGLQFKYRCVESAEKCIAFNNESVTSGG